MGNIRYKGGNYTRDARSSYVVVEPLSVTSNGTYTAESGKAYNPVTVNIQPARPKDVNFYDYDGTVVASYTKQEFLALAEMPANPTHERLTAQGWNYSLANAKAYVTAYGVLNVGQMYITDDRKTRLHIRLEEGRLNPEVGLGLNGTAAIDWGDGSELDTITGTSLSTAIYKGHVYTSAGEYAISIEITDGKALFFGASSYTYILRKAGGTDNENYVYFNTLLSIHLGLNMDIGGYAFYGCYALTSITIPDSVTLISNNAFNNCYSLTNITIPDGVMTIGVSAFQNCYSLASITIPDSVISIANNTFKNCYSLTSINIPDSISSTGTGVFNSCYSLARITIPDSVTSIVNSVFASCYPLASITIPDSVMTIMSSAFNNCYSLTNITIPDSVTSIDSGAFQNCSGLGFIKFKSTTPPAVGRDAFYNVPTDCIIYVPTGTIETYKATANMPNPSTYTYVEYTE